MSEAHNENVVGAPLKTAFLRGETVVAGHLAAALGVSRQGVTDALKRLSKRGLIKGQRVRPTGRGGSQVVWTCIDPAGMAAYVPKVACATAKPRPKEIAEVAPLMEVWGMRVVDIPLPTFRHEIWARDEVAA